MNERFTLGKVVATGLRVWARNFVPFVLITVVVYLPPLLNVIMSVVTMAGFVLLLVPGFLLVTRWYVAVQASSAAELAKVFE